MFVALLNFVTHLDTLYQWCMQYEIKISVLVKQVYDLVNRGLYIYTLVRGRKKKTQCYVLEHVYW